MEKYLSARLSAIIKNYRPDQFDFKFFKGEATLENLELEEAFVHTTFGIPQNIAIKKVFCNRADVNFPWKRIKHEPVVVNLDCVEMILEEVYPVPEPHLFPRRVGKRNVVDDAIEGMRVEINEIHVALQILGEDVKQQEVVPPLLRVDMYKVVIQGTNSNWEPGDLARLKAAYKNERIVCIHRLCEFESLTANVIDTNSELKPDPFTFLKEIPGKVHITQQRLHGERQFFHTEANWGFEEFQLSWTREHWKMVVELIIALRACNERQGEASKPKPVESERKKSFFATTFKKGASTFKSKMIGGLPNLKRGLSDKSLQHHHRHHLRSRATRHQSIEEKIQSTLGDSDDDGMEEFSESSSYASYDTISSVDLHELENEHLEVDYAAETGFSYGLFVENWTFELQENLSTEEPAGLAVFGTGLQCNYIPQTKADSPESEAITQLQVATFTFRELFPSREKDPLYTTMLHSSSVDNLDSSFSQVQTPSPASSNWPKDTPIASLKRTPGAAASDPTSGSDADESCDLSHLLKIRVVRPNNGERPSDLEVRVNPAEMVFDRDVWSRLHGFLVVSGYELYRERRKQQPKTKTGAGWRMRLEISDFTVTLPPSVTGKVKLSPVLQIHLGKILVTNDKHVERPPVFGEGMFGEIESLNTLHESYDLSRVQAYMREVWVAIIPRAKSSPHLLFEPVSMRADIAIHPEDEFPGRLEVAFHLNEVCFIISKHHYAYFISEITESITSWMDFRQRVVKEVVDSGADKTPPPTSDRPKDVVIFVRAEKCVFQVVNAAVTRTSVSMSSPIRMNHPNYSALSTALQSDEQRREILGEFICQPLEVCFQKYEGKLIYQSQVRTVKFLVPREAHGDVNFHILYPLASTTGSGDSDPNFRFTYEHIRQKDDTLGSNASQLSVYFDRVKICPIATPLARLAVFALKAKELQSSDPQDSGIALNWEVVFSRSDVHPAPATPDAFTPISVPTMVMRQWKDQGGRELRSITAQQAVLCHLTMDGDISKRTYLSRPFDFKATATTFEGDTQYSAAVEEIDMNISRTESMTILQSCEAQLEILKDMANLVSKWKADKRRKSRRKKKFHSVDDSRTILDHARKLARSSSERQFALGKSPSPTKSPKLDPLDVDSDEDETTESEPVAESRNRLRLSLALAPSESDEAVAPRSSTKLEDNIIHLEGEVDNLKARNRMLEENVRDAEHKVVLMYKQQEEARNDLKEEEKMKKKALTDNKLLKRRLERRDNELEKLRALSSTLQTDDPQQAAENLQLLQSACEGSKLEPLPMASHPRMRPPGSKPVEEGEEAEDAPVPYQEAMETRQKLAKALAEKETLGTELREKAKAMQKEYEREKGDVVAQMMVQRKNIMDLRDNLDRLRNENSALKERVKMGAPPSEPEALTPRSARKSSSSSK